MTFNQHESIGKHLRIKGPYLNLAAAGQIHGGIHCNQVRRGSGHVGIKRPHLDIAAVAYSSFGGSLWSRYVFNTNRSYLVRQQCTTHLVLRVKHTPEQHLELKPCFMLRASQASRYRVPKRLERTQGRLETSRHDMHFEI